MYATDTQIEALASIGDQRTLKERILAFLRQGNATDDEIIIALGGHPTSVQGRRSHLTSVGLVRDSGFRRKSRRNHNQIVWELAD